MTGSLFEKPKLGQAIADLRKDLLDEGGPRISTMRNYRFAILLYDPTEEFDLRREIRGLSDELKGSGWNVLSISLQKLMIERLKQVNPKVLDSIIRMEHRLYDKDPDRALNHLKEKISLQIERADGIAKDVIDWIDEFVEKYPVESNRTLIFIGRTGSLYPFFRTSALLKHLDGKTRNLPVVLLYPGKRQERQSLSFMGELSADRDYRPRVYS
jgi:Domain of unknown function (DUF1788)